MAGEPGCVCTSDASTTCESVLGDTLIGPDNLVALKEAMGLTAKYDSQIDGYNISVDLRGLNGNTGVIPVISNEGVWNSVTEFREAFAALTGIPMSYLEGSKGTTGNYSLVQYGSFARYNLDTGDWATGQQLPWLAAIFGGADGTIRIDGEIMWSPGTPSCVEAGDANMNMRQCSLYDNFVYPNDMGQTITARSSRVSIEEYWVSGMLDNQAVVKFLCANGSDLGCLGFYRRSAAADAATIRIDAYESSTQLLVSIPYPTTEPHRAYAEEFRQDGITSGNFHVGHCGEGAATSSYGNPAAVTAAGTHPNPCP